MHSIMPDTASTRTIAGPECVLMEIGMHPYPLPFFPRRDPRVGQKTPMPHSFEPRFASRRPGSAKLSGDWPFVIYFKIFNTFHRVPRESGRPPPCPCLRLRTTCPHILQGPQHGHLHTQHIVTQPSQHRRLMWSSRTLKWLENWATWPEVVSANSAYSIQYPA